jgi:guanylate kinase
MSVVPTGRIFVLSAPSGAGKTVLADAAQARLPQLKRAVTHTTRPPREGEVDGVDYHFAEIEAMRGEIAAGKFLEHADVFGKLYGTSIAAVEQVLSAGQDVLLVIDVQGAAAIRAKRPDARLIFVLPPSRAELERRLSGRGTDAPEVIARRLSEAASEIRHAAEFDDVLVNDDLETAISELVGLFQAPADAPAQRPVDLAERVTALVQSP